MVEAALRRFVPPGWSLEVEVAASVPPGSGLGTSASVVVGLIAALQALDGNVAEPSALARAAHRVETVDAALQSGVQDHIAAAHGGASLIEIDPYPAVEVLPLELAEATWDALARRILTVYLGDSRPSNAVHDAVISHLDSRSAALLAPLRDAARRAAGALVAGSIDEYGEAMIANTEAQGALYPALINPLANELIELARRHGAVGWKVNGAGGQGGTVTIVTPDDPGGVGRALTSLAGVMVVPLRPARQGARIVDQA
jgi:D-glycero-alpha-D-manno-heptose-7-phosphate kinase